MSFLSKHILDLLAIIALLLIQTSYAETENTYNKIGEPLSIELEIPEELEEDFSKFSDIIDMGEVNNINNIKTKY